MQKGDRLPFLALPQVLGGPEQNLRGGRGPRVLVTMHDLRCDRCLGYVEELAALASRLEEWGARVSVITPGNGEANADALFEVDLPVLRDADGRIARGQLAVIIADEWGEVYFASEPDDLHGAIPVAEVLDWVRFIAIQCPECEGPEGNWRNL